MNWKEWDKTYPCREIKCLPKYFDAGPLDDRQDAEQIREGIESFQETGGIEVFLYQGKYYVGNRQDVDEISALEKIENHV